MTPRADEAASLPDRQRAPVPRRAAFSRALAGRLSDVAEAVLADIARLPHSNADLTGHPEAEPFKAAIVAADGLVFITPEYNSVSPAC